MPNPSPALAPCIATLAPLAIGRAILKILEAEGGATKSTLSQFGVPRKSAYRWVSAARTQREMLSWESSDTPDAVQRAALENLGSVAVFQFLGAHSREPKRRWEIFIAALWLARGGRLKLSHLRRALETRPGQSFDRRDPRTKRFSESIYRLRGLRKYLHLKAPTAGQRRDAVFTLDEALRLLGRQKDDGTR